MVNVIRVLKDMITAIPVASIGPLVMSIICLLAAIHLITRMRSDFIYLFCFIYFALDSIWFRYASYYHTWKGEVPPLLPNCYLLKVCFNHPTKVLCQTHLWYRLNRLSHIGSPFRQAGRTLPTKSSSVSGGQDYPWIRILLVVYALEDPLARMIVVVVQCLLARSAGSQRCVLFYFVSFRLFAGTVIRTWLSMAVE